MTGPINNCSTGTWPEQRLVERALRLGDGVDESVVAPVVALQHPPHHVGRASVVERDVQQGQPRGLATLRLGHEDQRATVGAPRADENFLFGCDAVLRTAEFDDALHAAGKVTRHTAPVDDRDRVRSPWSIP